MSTFCKFETALEILVGKWKPVILLRLFSNGTMRFSELQKAIPDITKKMLTQQLRELEYHDIVHREIYRQIPPKVEYSITEYGKGMATILQALNDWGVAHVEHLNELYGTNHSVETHKNDAMDK
ncbi:transcriptional regulator [Paenibacillus chitinolyticus]|uniref:Transcriptional regulator n=1 Tax=Paenibacillus chitinolyticus TaxID=79263 RepID=A0A410WQ90_9BACL|nr:helix-turn-helix domain-containing protein [Paenibacillus chitinolyticus]MCY9591037.1 helix-turn-helix transcriptional regulator [Paenibacillus chitinolyticus]MCY9597162.1 helix-turn-helix transcriptional regulator [Paenibacillus chitinolyticus]QAV16467.1 transcriptional regulator [Paenibacillus chitinolyticus]